MDVANVLEVIAMLSVKREFPEYAVVALVESQTILEDTLGRDDTRFQQNALLRYGWGYSIGSIIVSLAEFCKTSSLDPKRTYVWICCLCNNQHRIVESVDVPFTEFHAVFHKRVTGVGNILALMEPWHSPLYLTRAWCVFEMFTAVENSCNVTILMPPNQQQNMIEDIIGDSGRLERLYEVLGKTDIEEADSSVPQDKTRILDLVKKELGCKRLNRRVNQFLRQWVHSEIRTQILARHENAKSLNSAPKLAICSSRMGTLKKL
jgi:hypothetical protein